MIAFAPTRLDLIGSGLLVLAALLVVRAAIAARRLGRPAGVARFWWVAAVLLLLAGLYRLTGAEHLLTDRLRQSATGEGWYGGRRIFQAALTSVGVVVAAAALWIALRLRAGWPERLAALALVGYAVLSILRLVSLHMVDSVLYRSLGPIHANWLFELALVGAVAVGAAAATRPPRRSAVRPGRQGRR